MELYFKIPEGKPPFIGVIFENSEQAQLNKDLLECEPKKFTIMAVGISNDTLSFNLFSENEIRRYDRVRMDYAAFKRWRAYSHLKMNFAHILLIHDQPVVVKINKKLFVLPIERFMTDAI